LKQHIILKLIIQFIYKYFVTKQSTLVVKPGLCIKKSITSLIYCHIKEHRFARRSELATHLGYSVRSMELWLRDYKDKGLGGMLIIDKPKQRRKCCINETFIMVYQSD